MFLPPQHQCSYFPNALKAVQQMMAVAGLYVLLKSAFHNPPPVVIYLSTLPALLQTQKATRMLVYAIEIRILCVTSNIGLGHVGIPVPLESFSILWNITFINFLTLGTFDYRILVINPFYSPFFQLTLIWFKDIHSTVWLILEVQMRNIG